MPPSLQDEIDRVLSKLQINTAKLLKILFGKIKEDFVNLDTTKRKLWTDEVNKNITSYFSPPPFFIHTVHSHLLPLLSWSTIVKRKKNLYCVHLYSFCLGPTGINQGHLWDYEFGALCWNLVGSAEYYSERQWFSSYSPFMDNIGDFAVSLFLSCGLIWGQCR